jgi:hypothetical protein
MAEAGAPAGARGRCVHPVTLVGVRPVPNMNPAYQYRVEYVRPEQGAARAAPGAPAAATGHPAGAQPQQSRSTDPQGQPPSASQATATPAGRQVAPQPMPQQAGTSADAAAGSGCSSRARPDRRAAAGFNPEQAALFAKLTGQPRSLSR